MRYLSFLPCLILLVCLRVSAADRANVLLIAIDDLNDWTSGLAGHAQAKTPNLDRLAARGVSFTNAHCQAPICNPSRTSFMLGLRPSNTGIYQNRPWFRTVNALRDRVTMSQHFGAQGYKTMTAGKIYHASGVDPKSFQELGPRPGQRNGKDKHVVKGLPSKTPLWDYGPQAYPDAEFNDYVTASYAVEQLKAKHDKPFFLAVGLVRPHVPLYAPQRLFDERDLNEVALPVVKDNDRDDISKTALDLIANPTPPPHEYFEKNPENWRTIVRAYLAATQFADEQVGRILDALDAGPHAKNTIIILLSDHGWHLGEKRVWAKRTLWERSTRVPFIVSVPGGVAGAKCSKPVELLSMYPTLIELCGIKPRDDLDGVSIAPLLADPTATWTRPAITTFMQNNHAVRSERWRYIRYHDGSEELYDHASDPHEWTNRASDPTLKDVIAAHRKFLPTTNVPEAKSTRKKRGTKK